MTPEEIYHEGLLLGLEASREIARHLPRGSNALRILAQLEHQNAFWASVAARSAERPFCTGCGERLPQLTRPNLSGLCRRCCKLAWHRKNEENKRERKRTAAGDAFSDDCPVALVGG